MLAICPRALRAASKALWSKLGLGGQPGEQIIRVITTLPGSDDQ